MSLPLRICSIYPNSHIFLKGHFAPRYAHLLLVYIKLDFVTYIILQKRINFRYYKIIRSTTPPLRFIHFANLNFYKFFTCAYNLLPHLYWKVFFNLTKLILVLPSFRLCLRFIVYHSNAWHKNFRFYLYFGSSINCKNFYRSFRLQGCGRYPHVCFRHHHRT